MPEETKNDNVIVTRETVEVLDQKGDTLNRDTPLADIFDKIEEVKSEGGSAEDVVGLNPQAQPGDPVKPEKKAKEPKAEVKSEVKSDVKPETKAESEEVSRSRLREEPEVKPEEPKETKSDDDVPPEELGVLPHDKPKTAKRIQALLKKIDAVTAEATKTKSEAQEKASKLAELEKKLTEVQTVDPKTKEEIQKQKDELAMFRRRYALDKDPEVKTKFDGRVDSAEKAIVSVLTKNRASEALLKAIEAEGGWAKFAESGRMIPLANEGTISTAELADAILQKLPLGDRKSVEASMLEQVQTRRDKERFFREEEAKANEFFTKQEEEAKRQAEEQEKLQKETASHFEKFVNETVEKTDWLKLKEIPANATPEQKTAIESDNRYTKQLIGLLKKSFTINKPDEVAELVLDSVRFYQERREKAGLLEENKKLKAELKAKQGEIDKFKGASRSVPKSGSIAGGGSSASPQKSEGPVGLEAALNIIQTKGRQALEQGAGEDDDE